MRFDNLFFLGFLDPFTCVEHTKALKPMCINYFSFVVAVGWDRNNNQPSPVIAPPPPPTQPHFTPPPPPVAPPPPAEDRAELELDVVPYWKVAATNTITVRLSFTSLSVRFL